MIREGNSPDSHATWLNDIEYREEYVSEAAKLETAAAFLIGREAMDLTQSKLAKRAGTSKHTLRSWKGATPIPRSAMSDDCSAACG